MINYIDTCIFCKIAAGKMGTELISEGENVVAFYDIHPSAPVHVLIVPRTHVESADELSSDHDGLWQEMLELAQGVARNTGVSETGYRLVTNVGPDSGQEIPHLHLHLLGGKQLGSIS